MNTDAVNQSESLLNNYLTKVLHILQRNAFDPLMRVTQIPIVHIFY